MAQILTKASASQAPTLNFHVQEELPRPKATEVLVKFLAAPINPLDILVLNASYPVKPSHKHSGEAIPGYDGVGEILRCGADVRSLLPGDLVVPSQFGIGTHLALPCRARRARSHCRKWLLGPYDLAFAAVFRISIVPAFCLVEDMCSLRPGDCIILNAGTSAVAQMVVQFARRRGAGVISVVRDRPRAQLEEVKRSLYALGAHMVVAESQLGEDARIKTNRITLALDSVFGPSGRALVKALSVGGTYVQLGFLGGAKAQVTLDPSDLFGRQITMKGFRGSAQVGSRSLEEQSDLFNWLVDLFNAGDLKLPSLGLQKIEWVLRDRDESKERVLEAISRAKNGSLGQRKQIIVFKE